MKLRDEIKANDLVLFTSGALVEWVLVLNVNIARCMHMHDSIPCAHSCTRSGTARSLQVRTQGGETFTINVRRVVRPMDLSEARERLIRDTLTFEYLR